ncbi:hypothetical protein AKI39_23615 [Bordetella sp. H567]|nr:hypothetical protein AKI39_23615 [Bordetella sp. H567]
MDGKRISVYAARPAEVRSVYSKSNYGILCREAHIINKVACPTKLIEYLSFAVLPIMGTPQVGDFTDMGMCYATMEQFSASHLPTGIEYSEMVANNFIVLQRLAELANSGRKQLLAQLR